MLGLDFGTDQCVRDLTPIFSPVFKLVSKPYSFRKWYCFCPGKDGHALPWYDSCNYFYGPVPVSEVIEDSCIKDDYKFETEKLIARTFKNRDYHNMSACLVVCHGLFSWRGGIMQMI